MPIPGQLSTSYYCIGSMSVGGGFVSPANVTTQQKVFRAMDTLQNNIATHCTNTQLAALDACAADPAGLASCLICTNWRGAVNAVQSAYGPR